MGKKGGGGSPPSMSAGDMIRVAEKEGKISRELLRAQTGANRPTQYTPWGDTVWTQLGPDQWKQNVWLPPDEMRALRAQQAIGAGRSELALGLLGRATEELEDPINWDPLDPNAVLRGGEGRQAAEDAIYRRSTSRLDPYWEQQQAATEAKLWGQGLRPGDEAYDTAMGNLERARTDAYQTALDQAIVGGGVEAQRTFGMDMQRRQQAIAEMMKQRGATLNEISALTSGQAVQTPDFPGFARQGVGQTPDLTGATQAAHRSEWDRWNAQQAQQQGMWSGIMDIAGAALPFFFSDRRLKSDIIEIGRTPAGQPIYEYMIFGYRTRGVMAQESPADAVWQRPDGFLMVDYSRIR